MLTPESRQALPSLEVLPYPAGMTRFVLRAPLLLYRMGLGNLLNIFRLVVLTTQGRKSGTPRHTIVEYRMHGTKIYIVSAWGKRPHWVKNLLANPYATLQAGNRTYGTKAHLVSDTSEILRALYLFRKRAPAFYDAIIARLTDADSVDARSLPELADQITVIRLDLCDGERLPSLKRDLAWVWGVGVLSLVGLVTWFVVKQRSSP